MGRRNSVAGKAQAPVGDPPSVSKSRMPSATDDLRLEVARLRARLRAQTEHLDKLQQRKRVMRERLSAMVSEYEATKEVKRDMAEKLDRLQQERIAANRRYKELKKTSVREKEAYDKEREAWDKLESSLKAQCREDQTRIKGLQKLLKPDQPRDPSEETAETQGANDSATPHPLVLETPAGEPHILEVTNTRPMPPPAGREPTAKGPVASPRNPVQARRPEPPRRRARVAESVTSEYMPSRRPSAGVAKTSSRPSRASAGKPIYVSPDYDKYSVFGGH
ncbi:hypothetical protein RB598_005461 [Gaeumannomyces tritici]